jgi:hypothetical protein
MRIRNTAVMAEEVVAGRNIEVTNLHCGKHTISRAGVTGALTRP